MSESSLIEALRSYALSGTVPLHTPGHKRNVGLLGKELPYQIDITEIPGFDNLQSPEGILRRTAELAAGLYGSERAFLSVNGSTGLILAAVRACARPRDKIIMARNCHRSVYNAVEINMLRPAYVSARADAETGILGGVEPERVRDALKTNPDARLVVITSPTYEGCGSDIRAIAAAAHEFGVPLLVDAAHGAHLGFSGYFGESAVQAGADIAVMSLHKTLPALTQCALMHLRGGLVDEAALQDAVNAFQTSSPSYILLSSLDACLRLVKAEGGRLFADYELRLRGFREAAGGLKRLGLFCGGGVINGERPAAFSFDPGRLVILTYRADISGPELAALLRSEYKIETELAAPDYVLALTSVCDADENFGRLAAALLEIDAGLGEVPAKAVADAQVIPRAAAAPWELYGREGEAVELPKAAGRVSLEYVWAYPPGIPLVVPGEALPKSLLEQVRAASERGGPSYRSSRGAFPKRIFCLKE